MKNKKLLYIGLGVVALVGLYFIFRPSDDDSTPTTEGKSNSNNGSGNLPTSSGAMTPPVTPLSAEEEPIAPISSGSRSMKERRQNRRNCNKEARGIYGARIPLSRKKREAKAKFKADCYKNGGFDDGTGE